MSTGNRAPKSRPASDLTFGDPTPPVATVPQAKPEPANAVAPVSPESPSWLGRSEERDTGDGSDGGVSISLSALARHPQLDPELDLVNKGVSLPRYLNRALKAEAFFSGHKEQDIVAAALRAHLRPEIVTEFRRAAGG